MNTLLNKQFNHDITNLILCELERVKFDEVLTEMNEIIVHDFKDGVHTIEYRCAERNIDYIESEWNERYRFEDRSIWNNGLYVAVMHNRYDINFEGDMSDEADDSFSLVYRNKDDELLSYDFKTLADTTKKYRELVKESKISLI